MVYVKKLGWVPLGQMYVIRARLSTSRAIVYDKGSVEYLSGQKKDVTRMSTSRDIHME